MHPDEADFYSQRYPSGYLHAQWPDHVERIAATVSFATSWLEYFNIRSVADLSAGDGALVRGLLTAVPYMRWAYVGDLNPGPEMSQGWNPVPGRDHVVLNPNPLTLMKGLDVLDGVRSYLGSPVDLLVCSETLEHLDDPDAFLERATLSARSLLLTTPENETATDNPEHYWGWDSEAVSQMLHDAGWNTVDHRVFTPVTAQTYRFQMWMATR